MTGPVITPRSTDISRWYLDIITNAKLADYGPVKGTMVIRPYAYSMWERMSQILDGIFKETGVENAYFPLLIPESYIKKEAEHVEGFSPELAVVTIAGGKELEEPAIIRPTSETIINAFFAKWIMSYRDLPVLINQWCNVVRWEMRTRPFLRTSEFLWQEGHTAHENQEEAEAKTLEMLEIYRKFAEETLAIPVMVGRKTETQKFAGAVATYAIESLMQDNRALQAGTSHFLGQNFAKAFEICFQDRQGNQAHVWQTSWGVSTRLIGALILTHGDDKGLRLPPLIAPIQVVIIPIYKKNDQKEKDEVLKAAQRLANSFADDVRVKVDDSEQDTPGFKFNEWELKGVPLRIEIGPRDLKQNACVVARRDTGEKTTVKLEAIGKTVDALLEDVQSSLLKQAQQRIASNTHDLDDYKKFKDLLEEKGGLIYAHWCGDKACEGTIQDETKGTIRVIPFDQKKEVGKCIRCQKPSQGRVIFAKAY